MSQTNPDNAPDNDGENREELGWNEFDWQIHLRDAEAETGRFLEHYDQLREEPDHLDAAARAMGWDSGDWTGDDAAAADDDDEDDDDALGELLADDPGPYTVHRHPVHVATRGLYRQLRQLWADHGARPGAMTPSLAIAYADALRDGEIQALLGIQALDLGDFGLAVCHFKAALSALNQTLRLLAVVPPTDELAVALLRKESLLRVFDLREIWLRVMRDCREEIRRDPGETD